jgi:hypothetical protein
LFDSEQFFPYKIVPLGKVTFIVLFVTIMGVGGLGVGGFECGGFVRK